MTETTNPSLEGRQQRCGTCTNVYSPAVSAIQDLYDKNKKTRPVNGDRGGRHLALPPPTRRLLHRDEAAAYVGVSPNLFDSMIVADVMPKPRVFRTRKLWDIREIDAAIDALPKEGEGERASTWDDV